MHSFERLTPGAQCVSVTVSLSTASCRTNPTTYSWTRSSPSIVGIPGFVPRVLTANAPSWLAQFPQWSSAGTPAVHAVRMFDELGAALAALSYDLPLILILEDLQWADADSVNALARLAESQIPSKLLIVGTCCDGEWTAGERAHERLLAVAAASPRSAMLPLGCLTLEHVARYVDARFGPECLSELAPAVHQATGGNPFMMVNAIDSLVARRLVVLEDDRWRREASLDAIARRAARNARRSDCATRRPSRPVGTRSARSGCGGRARVHGLGGRRRAPAESRIRQARAGSDGPPRAPTRCVGAVGETAAVGSARPSARRTDHLQVPACAVCRPHRAAGTNASTTPGRRAPQSSSATSTCRPRRRPPSRLRSSPPYGVGTLIGLSSHVTEMFQAPPCVVVRA